MIRGEFDASDPYPKPWVRVFLFLAGISTTWTEVRFLLDTGAGKTCLHPRDAIAVGVATTALITPSSWPRVVNLSGVGGTMQYFETAASFGFPQVDGNLHLIDQTILVAQARRTNTRLPSLLGWDVLRGFRLGIDLDVGRIELDPYAPNVVQVPNTPYRILCLHLTARYPAPWKTESNGFLNRVSGVRITQGSPA